MIDDEERGWSTTRKIGANDVIECGGRRATVCAYLVNHGAPRRDALRKLLAAINTGRATIRPAADDPRAT